MFEISNDRVLDMIIGVGGWGRGGIRLLEIRLLNNEG